MRSPTSPPSRLAQPSVGKARTGPMRGHPPRERLAHGRAAAGAERAHAPDPGDDDAGPCRRARAQRAHPGSAERRRAGTGGSGSDLRTRRSSTERTRPRAGRATMGTQSKATSGSGSARLAVGGTSSWTSVSTVAIASRAPAAAIVCPTQGLVRAHEHRVRIEQLAEGGRLDAVVLSRAGPVRVDVPDGARRDRRPAPAPPPSPGRSPSPSGWGAVRCQASVVRP